MRATWNIVAVLCLFIAAALWVMSYVNAAFVVAALGVVAWFLNQRTRFKIVRDEYEASRLRLEDESDKVSVEADAREQEAREVIERG
ncbi:MAG: hypothetical protein MSG64_11940 [Pyrinomonadaceae bacterium MAG19_C2-C3]|nr:hypothetical protein [Pyrinomonadaceae bacterium MAG19_C2-C3]